ncbi:Pcc1-domain-containing protein [Glonium stellatum]|uniref:Pcc1-domain-containing protein n=1 Tax=Glonium stellatum TaxID=574774 RepID=A0A8E2JW32_9PEZI|nr:Pcc1-domain-containing protein [Glonium stellatum]
MAVSPADSVFPCSLYVSSSAFCLVHFLQPNQANAAYTACRTLNIPFPTPHLANTALRALAVDQELSPLVRRSFALASSGTSAADGAGGDTPSDLKHVLQVFYSATTNRMLRVAVNGFFESVGVVLGVMEELDVDVLGLPGREGLEGVQGVEKIPG